MSAFVRPSPRRSCWSSRAASTRARTSADASPPSPAIASAGGWPDPDEDVDPVGERPAQLRLVASDGGRRALARARPGPVPAGAGIRGRDQREPARELDRAPGARQRHPPILERLAKRLDRVAAELAELVEEQDSPVGPGHLARAGRRPASDQGAPGSRVVRGAKRPAGDRPPPPPPAPAILITSSASERVSAGMIDGSRRAASVLPAPGGPTSSRLWPPAATISSARRSAGWPLRSRRSGPAACAAATRPDRAAPRAGSIPPPAAGSFETWSSATTSTPSTSAASAESCGGHRDPRVTLPARRLGHRQRAGHRPDRPVQGELAGERRRVEEVLRDLARRRQHAGGDRQVEPRPDLRQVGRARGS